MRFATRHIATFATATAAALSLLASGAPAHATQFQQQEVDQRRFVAVASPGGISHQLLILEQISNARPCWRETGNSPTVVEPLLVNFDFTGICGRSTDSNGYSVRIGGQDLNWRYILRIVEQDDDLVLMAVPAVDRTLPSFEIGRTNGTTDDFARIELNPGWRMTRRTFEGEALGHIYLTNNIDFDTLVAQATPTRPTPPSTSRPPSNPRNDRDRPSTSPTPSDSVTPRTGYSVVVRADSRGERDRVRRIVPTAFNTTINGQEVMQAGLFRDRDQANALRQQLRRENLQAGIIPLENGRPVGNDDAISRSPTASPTPSTRPSTPSNSRPRPQPSTPPRTQPSTDLPRITNERVVVMVDPGHGGADVGAVGLGGIQEADIVLDISRQVASILERQGVQAILTRQDDREIDLEPRVALADQRDANLFVSIHANAAESEANGVETYYYSSGQALAQSIQTSVIESTNMIDRGVKQARFYVLTQSSMPAALVEVGFVTGREDSAKLRTASFRTQMAEAIARGVLRYVASR